MEPEMRNVARTSAPGRLALVHEFMMTGGLSSAADLRPEVAEEIRRRRALGAGQPALAAEFGLSQRFTSALLRGNHVEDELGSMTTAERWLGSHNLAGQDATLDDAGLARLVELRGVLRSIASTNNHDSDHEDNHDDDRAGAPSPFEHLNAIAAAVPFALRFAAPAEAHLAHLAPRPVGIDAAIAQLLATVFDAMRDGTWQRLKACGASDCVGIFYDTSRNRTGTWCSMAVCGNRTKARAFQERRKRAVSQG